MNGDQDNEYSSWQENYILTGMGQQSLAFPARWVDDILVIERSQILPLPFYDSQVVGMLHHKGKLVPLVLVIKPEKEQTRWLLKRNLVVVRLNENLTKLAGVGVVVERVIKSIRPSELTDEHLFQQALIPDTIWQPERWS